MSVPAPVSLQKPLLDADSIDHAAAYMEMTVPILHVAKSASSYLLEASQPRSSQVPCNLPACALQQILQLLTAAAIESARGRRSDQPPASFTSHAAQRVSSVRTWPIS